ncbi:hypothetical protein K505DRAFT_375527 [Melanomma pulvis-pyrius CBS 109.77]|uniref:Uncharacterized protein n=1 Tax=Melanomma pulvis-pyrius CBS 109.77 TaxID=1314802 RepID=A0A6A6X9R0_9PLEO|nr:hypothetical protein K505DRAFT_375527 [Melanomma pulvis-pyrius CBS 109.77]
MSGNPFRASLLQNPTSSASAPPTSFLNHGDSKRAGALEVDVRDSVHASPLPAKSKTKKSVRIESPTSSPPHPAFHDADTFDDNDLQQRLQEREGQAPPPFTSPAGFPESFEDYAKERPFGGVRDGRDNAYEAPDATASMRTHSGMVGAALSPSGAPVNPFSRTLATIESQEKGSAELGRPAGQNRDRPAAEKTAPGTTKPSLDVESFKRLLMTGIQSPPVSGTLPQTAPAIAPNPINASLLESSSSTDTSSISRQSIFEPVQEPHIESPRTSYEMAASDDDERVVLVRDARKSEKKKPPPPRHRHGKPVTSRTPQVVSFSEFSATQPTSSPISRNRVDSDLNKPLPVPPILSPTAHIFPQDTIQDEPPPLETRASESSGQSDTPSVQKKVPPPVPIARRQSQLRSSTIGNRSRSNSSLTMTSQHSTDYSVLIPSASNEPTYSPVTQKAPPPPPPARRHGAAATSINPPSNNSSTTELPSTASTRRTPVSSPNPPSSRRPTFSSPPPSPAPGLTRTSSVSSNLNPRSVSNESATMPPPPPPPRRRQSGRSSLDKERPYPLPTTSPTESRRTSSENKRSSFDSKRRTSVASESSLRHEYARASENDQELYSPQEEVEVESRGLGLSLQQTTSGERNILDDMEKFQREIDELRAKYKPVG